MPQNLPSKFSFKKHLTAVLAVLIIVNIISAQILLVPRTKAIPVEVISDIPATVKQVQEKSFGKVITAALDSVVQMFFQKMAYDIAVDMAAGATGQKPRFERKKFNDYVNDAGKAAAGEFIGSLSQQWGINLCAPSIDVQFKFSYGLLKEEQPPVPKCDWNKVKDNWQSLGHGEWVKNVGLSLSPTESDIGLFMTILGEKATKKANQQQAALQTIPATTLRGPTDLISGALKAPGEYVEEWVKESAAAPKESFAAQIQGSYVGKTISSALITFANTFMSRVVNSYLKKGLVWSPYKAEDPFASINLTSPSSGSATSGRAAAQLAFASLKQISIQPSGVINILDEFATCPQDDKKYASPDNCVIDSKFADAVRQKMSVREAIDQGLLLGSAAFGWEDPVAGREPTSLSGYSDSSIKKLRLYRIVSTGWEVASQQIKKDGISAPLKEVVDGFYTPTSRFYHLVDPNWVLKAPESYCNANVYGEVPEGDSGERRKTCVDIRSCVLENKDDTCKSTWGYCTREKNVWEFSGDECKAEYNTCQTFTDSAGKPASYLTNSTDTVNCDASSASCKKYSRKYNTTTNKWDSVGFDGTETSDIYFDKDAQTCEADNSGCSEYIQFAHQSQTFNEVSYATGTHLFIKNAGSCTVDEVGCQAYYPKSGDPMVPGIISATSTCPAECSGYDDYVQQATNFEVAPAAHFYFIPSRAKSCSAQDAGCEEFTNLDKVASGGESREYYKFLRSCQKPSTTTQTFYTWEGSDTAGYQLKTFSLIAAGSFPQGIDCALDTANPDCREFYNTTGATAYRYYSSTIISSDDCHQFRRAQDDSLVMAFPPESISCAAQNAGCKEYKGNNSANVRNVIKEEFETMVNKNWTTLNTANLYSAESINVGGHSLALGDALLLGQIIHNVASSTTKGKTYRAEWWAKAQGPNPPGPGRIVSVYFNSVSLGLSSYLPAKSMASFQDIPNQDTWQKFSVGPLVFDREPAIDENLIVQANGVYIDNFILTEADSIYVVKNSWNTADLAACDVAGNTDVTVDGSELGCEQYKDKNQSDLYIKQFAKLCKEEVIGCERLVNTHNYNDEAGKLSSIIFDLNSTPIITTDDIIVPQANETYVVNNPDNYCAVADKGCKRLGVFNISTGSSTDVYIKDNPDIYGRSLCAQVSEGCEQWNSAKGMSYFKNPQTACEYKTVAGKNNNEYGWFKKGTDVSCSGGFELPIIGWPNISNSEKKIVVATTTAPNDGIAGTCPAEQDSCTAFMDPIDGKSYYYFNNDGLEIDKCTGVSRKEGCILFNDTSDPNLTYNASATYTDSESKQNASVPPITGTDTNRILKVSRDRVCAEWLYCASTMKVWDPAGGQFKTICQVLNRCEGVNEGKDVSYCNKPKLKSTVPFEVLDKDEYVVGNTGNWGDRDYSGYSLYNRYPLEYLTNYYDGSNYLLSAGPSGSLGVDGIGTKVGKTCRGFPEPSAPFPQAMKNWTADKANLCQTAGTKDCECDYDKDAYTNGDTRYYIATTGGSYLSFTENGELYKAKTVATLRGWRGYCLENTDIPINGDTNVKSCLTWMPMDLVGGESDIFSSYASAGANISSSANIYYISEMRGNNYYSGQPVTPQQYRDSETHDDSNPQRWSYDRIFYGRLNDDNWAWGELTTAGLTAGWSGGGGWANIWPDSGAELANRFNIYWRDIDWSSSDLQWYCDTDYCGGGSGTMNFAWNGTSYQATCSAFSNTFTIDIYPSGQKLDKIRYDFADGSASTGTCGFAVDLKLKEPINYIDKVAGGGLNITYTDDYYQARMNPASPFSGMPYEYNKSVIPFGALDTVVATEPFISTLYHKASTYGGSIDNPPYACLGNCGTAYSSVNGLTYSNSVIQLKKIFAKSYNVWQLNPSGNYISASGWDITNTGGASKPVIKQVKTNLLGIASEGADNAISVNGYPNEGSGYTNPVIYRKPGQSIVVTFYGYNADGQHMPITDVKVDWDDGTSNTIPASSLKNHKQACGSANFGDRPEACEPNYFIFTYSYAAPGTYKPKAVIRDNWGWCSGGLQDGIIACPSNGNWAFYPGTVVVTP